MASDAKSQVVFTEMVKKRIKELQKINTGNASETPAPVDRNAFDFGEILNNQIGETPETIRSRESSPRVILEHSTELVGGSDVAQIWEKINKMDVDNKKQCQQQGEIMSNIAASLIQLQESIGQNGNSSTMADQADISISDDESVDVAAKLNEIVTDENERSSVIEGADPFFMELETIYAEENKYGENVNDEIARLAESAINRQLKEEELSKLMSEKHLTPGNCTKLDIPKINKELWSAHKEKHEADLAVQAVQKYVSLAMVPVVKIMSIIKNKGDLAATKVLAKDTFMILAQGIATANKRRKMLIRPVVPLKYRKVCDIDAPVTEFLFGDDLDTKVDEIEKMEKRSQKLATPVRSFLPGTPKRYSGAVYQGGKGQYQQSRYVPNQYNNQNQKTPNKREHSSGNMKGNRGKPSAHKKLRN